MSFKKAINTTIVLLCTLVNVQVLAGNPLVPEVGMADSHITCELKSTGDYSPYTKEVKQPWISLFNGENLDGWTQVGEATAEAKDGEIYCHMKANTQKHTYVCTSKDYSDFILEMDILTDVSYSSGIVLRGQDKPLNCDTCANLYGYQIKIDPTERSWTGGIYETFGTGFHWYYTLENDERARKAYKIGEWNHLRVEAIGKHIKVWVNDIPTANMLHSKYETGCIAIKIHRLNNVPEKESSIGRFKNVRIISKNPENYAKSMEIPPVEVY